MTILKEREAVDYLQRARSCLHPKEEDIFPNTNLLAKMLEIEVAYIERAALVGPEALSTVSIDSTGFPELPSFTCDMTKAFAIGDSLQGDRIKALKPWLNQFRNFSLEGIISESEKSSSLMDRDYKLMQVLEGVTPTMRGLIVNNKKPPFHLRGDFPGLIFTQLDRINYTLIWGFKYIDSKNPARTPAILCIVVENSLEHSRVLGLTPEISGQSYKGRHSDRSTCSLHRLSWMDCPCISNTSNIIPVGTYMLDEPFELKATVSQHDKQIIMRFIEEIGKMHPLVKKAYLGLDTGCLSDSEIDSTIDVIHKFSDLVNNYVDSTNLIVAGTAVSGEQFLNSSLSLAKGFKEVLEVLPNLELQSSLRLTIAAVTQEIEDKMRKKESELGYTKLALPSAETASAVPKERLGWLKRSAWFAR